MAAPAHSPIPTPACGRAAVALAFASLLGTACGGLVASGPPDAGRTDAGLDAGIPDAGCVPFARPINAVNDQCSLTGPGAAYMTRQDAGCGATLATTIYTCTGTLTGPSNAFTALCKSSAPDLLCASATTPGRLGCQQADGGGACTIAICDTGTCLP
ncbi:MAG: hypothetical protein NVS2B9_19280 [Myxococcales bacterium]